MQYFAQRFFFFWGLADSSQEPYKFISPKDKISSILTVSNLQLIKC